MIKLRNSAAAIGVATLFVAAVSGIGPAAASEVTSHSAHSLRATQSPPENGVSIVPGSSINLVSAQSRVPIPVRNDYDTEVRVFLWAQPGALWIDMPKATQVVVPANTTVNATVPIKAISNGDVELRVYLTSFSGVRIGQAVWIHMHVERDFEPVMLLAFGSIVSALGFIGARRMLRRRRNPVGTTNS